MVFVSTLTIYLSVQHWQLPTCDPHASTPCEPGAPPTPISSPKPLIASLAFSAGSTERGWHSHLSDTSKTSWRERFLSFFVCTLTVHYNELGIKAYSCTGVLIKCNAYSAMLDIGTVSNKNTAIKHDTIYRTASSDSSYFLEVILLWG